MRSLSAISATLTTSKGVITNASAIPTPIPAKIFWKSVADAGCPLVRRFFSNAKTKNLTLRHGTTFNSSGSNPV